MLLVRQRAKNRQLKYSKNGYYETQQTTGPTTPVQDLSTTKTSKFPCNGCSMIHVLVNNSPPAF